MSNRVTSELFKEESAKLEQSRLMRLISMEIGRLSTATIANGEVVLNVVSTDEFEEGMLLSVRGASGFYEVLSIGVGEVTIDHAVDADLLNTEVYQLLNIVDANFDVDFAGIRYAKFPVQFSDIATNSDGSIDHANLTVANVSREIMYYVEQYDGLRGRRVQMRSVFADHLDELVSLNPDGTVTTAPNPDSDYSAFVLDEFKIDSYTVDENIVQFVLLPSVAINLVLPRRAYTAMSCYWDFGDPETCGYIGTDGTCDKTLEACKAKASVVTTATVLSKESYINPALAVADSSSLYVGAMVNFTGINGKFRVREIDTVSGTYNRIVTHKILLTPYVPGVKAFYYYVGGSLRYQPATDPVAPTYTPAVETTVTGFNVMIDRWPESEFIDANMIHETEGRFGGFPGINGNRRVFL